MPITILRNEDKDDWAEKENTDDLMVFKRGSKILICALPGYGKSNLCKNIICRTNNYKKYDSIYLCHIDKNSKEYYEVNSINCDIDELPDPENIDSNEKVLIILEDLCFQSLSKAQKAKIMMYLRYTCSHKGVTLIMLCHSFYSIPVIFRNKFDSFVIYKFDKPTMNSFCQKLYLEREELQSYVDLLQSKYDFLCIDISGNRPTVTFNMETVLKA